MTLYPEGSYKHNKTQSLITSSSTVDFRVFGWLGNKELLLIERGNLAW